MGAFLQAKSAVLKVYCKHVPGGATVKPSASRGGEGETRLAQGGKTSGRLAVYFAQGGQGAPLHYVMTAPCALHPLRKEHLRCNLRDPLPLCPSALTIFRTLAMMRRCDVVEVLKSVFLRRKAP